MGNLFSKGKTKVRSAGDDKPSSAPARLEGLDGTDPKTSSSAASTPPERPGSAQPALTVPAVDVKRSFAAQESTSEQANAQAAESIPLSPSKQGPKKIDVIGAQTDGSQLAKALKAKTEIPESAREWKQVFPEHVVRGFWNTADWKDREQSISAVHRSITNSRFISSQEAQAVWKTVCEMLAVCLRDKVAPIYHASLELLASLLAAYSNALPVQVLHSGTDSVVPIIIHRCGNNNTRIHEASLQALLGVASYSNYGTSYMGPFALAALPKKAQGASHIAQMNGRLSVISELLTTYRSTSGMGTEQVIGMCKEALEVPEEKVRQLAIKVIVELYRLRKMAGEDWDPIVHLGAIKPALIQVLNRKFNEVAEELRNGVSVPLSPAPSGLLLTSSASMRVDGKQLPPLAHSRTASTSSPSSPSLAATTTSGSSPPSSATASPSTPTGRPPRAPSRSRTPTRSRMGSLPSITAADGGGGTGSEQNTAVGLSPARGKVATRSPSPAARSAGSHSSAEGSTLGVPGTLRTGSRGGSHTSSVSMMSSYQGVLDDMDEQLIQYISGADPEAVAIH